MWRYTESLLYCYCDQSSEFRSQFLEIGVQDLDIARGKQGGNGVHNRMYVACGHPHLTQSYALSGVQPAPALLLSQVGYRLLFLTNTKA